MRAPRPSMYRASLRCVRQARQKSTQRPSRSQSPNRVGSSPLGPPISFALADVLPGLAGFCPSAFGTAADVVLGDAAAFWADFGAEVPPSGLRTRYCGAARNCSSDELLCLSDMTLIWTIGPNLPSLCHRLANDRRAPTAVKTLKRTHQDHHVELFPYREPGRKIAANIWEH